MKMLLIILITVSLGTSCFSQNSIALLADEKAEEVFVSEENVIDSANDGPESAEQAEFVEVDVKDIHIESTKQYGFEYFPLNTEVSYLYDSNAGETESGVVPSGDELVLTFDAGKMSYKQQFFKGEDGIYLTRTESSALLFFGTKVTYPEPVLRLPLPLEIGETWVWQGFEIADGDTGKLTITGEALGEEIVTTPIGEFNCLKIQLKINSEHGSKNTVTEWLAPEIGVVKFHAALEGKGLTAFLQDIFGLDELTFDLRGFNINRN
jgi:hypothetical protein